MDQHKFKLTATYILTAVDMLYTYKASPYNNDTWLSLPGNITLFIVLASG